MGGPGGVRSHLTRHADQIRRGGPRTVPAKAWHFSTRWGARLVMLLPALAAVALMRALRSVRLVRVGAIHSDRIGHFAANTELYLCERDAGLADASTFDVFYNPIRPVNRQLARMWKRKVRIWWFAKHVDWVNRRIPGGEAHVIRKNKRGHIDVHGLLGKMPPHLAFTPTEERRGRERLARIGVPRDKPWVCFHSRDPAYLQDVYKSWEDWSYHDFRDSDVNTYLPAASWLADRGVVPVRVGAVVAKPLETVDRRIVDYAALYRSDFMDVYLLVGCRFYFGDLSGLNEIPKVFRRPVIYLNAVPLVVGSLCDAAPGSLLIPKKLVWRASGRLMTFREMLEYLQAGFYRSEHFDQLGVDVVANSADEILDVVTEMELRLSGEWQDTPEDARLHEEFQRIFKERPEFAPMVTRMGAAFLRQNQELLS